MAFDYSTMSDEELARITGATLKPKQALDHSSMSDEELAKIAGVTLKPKLSDEIANNRFVKPAIDTINSIGAGANMAERELGSGAYNLLARTLGFKTMDAPKMMPSEYPNLAKASEFATNLAMPIPGVNKFKAAAEGGNALVKALASLGDAGATGAGYGMLYGANDKDKSLLKSGTEGAFFGSALHALLGGGSNLVQKVANRKINQLSDSAAKGFIKTPEEAKQAYEDIKPLIGDTKIDLGSLVGDKPLSRQYNEKLRYELGSSDKVRQNQRELLSKANAEVNDILSGMLGKSTDRSVHDDIIEKIQNIKDTHTANTRDKFNAITQEADQRGFNFPGWDNASSYAKQVIDEEKNVLGSGLKGELRSIITRLSSPSDSMVMDSMQKNNIKNQTNNINKKLMVGDNQVNNKPENGFQNAHFSHSNIGMLGDELASRGEYRAASIANTLQEKVRQDIQNALKNTNNQDLYQKWQQARKGFENDVVPFRRKSLSNILAGEKNASKISDELLADKNKGVLKHLDQETKNLIGYAQFHDLIKEKGASLQKVLNRAEKLRKSGDLEILTPEVQKRIKSLTTLNDMLPEAKIAYDPAGVGIRNYANTSGASKAAGLALVHAIGGTPLMLAGAALEPIYNNALSRYRTSNALRDAYIKGGFKYKDPSKKTTALTRALAAAMNSGDNNAN